MPAPSPAEVAQADGPASGSRARDDLEITVPFLPRPGRRRAQVGGVGRGRVDTAVLHFRPFGDDRGAVRDLSRGPPHRLRRGRRDAAPLAVPRARGRWPSGCASEAETPFEYVAAGQRLPADRVQLLRAPARRPARPGAARRLPARHQGGLLPALRGRDGAAAADGRRAGAGGDRLQPRRVLQAPRRLDRPRHRRPRVGRGVVRRSRLGHLRPDARRDAGPLADRRARGARAGRAPCRRRRGRPGGGGQAAQRLGGVRPDLLLDPQRNNRVDGAASRTTAASRGGRSRCSARPSCTVAWIVVRPPAPRARPAVAARPRGRRAPAGAPPRRPPGRDRHDPAPARARLGASEEATAYLRALSASPLRPGTRGCRRSRSAGRCAARSPRASGSPGGCARCGPCRRGGASTRWSRLICACASGSAGERQPPH